MTLDNSNEEKKRLSRERQNAVRNAWKQEQARVESGCGTRIWTIEQQKELLEKGSVSGFEGHHMKSVSLFPEQAGNPDNIQFLSEDEHFFGAHNGNYHNLTNGYYDPYSKEMCEFTDDELKPLPIFNLELDNSLDEAKKIFIEYDSDYCVVSENDIEEARENFIESNTGFMERTVPVDETLSQDKQQINYDRGTNRL